jgi:hypothetical protein
MVKTLVGTPDPQRPLKIIFTGDEAARIRRMARRMNRFPRDVVRESLAPSVFTIIAVVEGPPKRKAKP